MGIAKTLIEDWKRERKIKKHCAQIESLLKRKQGEMHVTMIKPQAANQKPDPDSLSRQDTQSKAGAMTMQIYDDSGQLNSDMEQMQREKLLNESVAAIINTCKAAGKQLGSISIECSHDNTNILVSVFDGKYVVGKWRFLPQPENSKYPIHLYHLNYHFNQTPGPNYHLQKSAKNIFTPEDTAEYIIKHDKKKAAADRKNRQAKDTNIDDLIGE